MESENPNLCNEHNTKSAKQNNKRKKSIKTTQIYTRISKRNVNAEFQCFFVSRWKKIATTTTITRFESIPYDSLYARCVWWWCSLYIE